ncbi:unnamed protein product [marine sediment metagenome]|uniref:Uncharacterized protein n=1 Tax=marine sediment metagenome TaxID=412755 RepID=X0W763_9ZZZZ
MRSKGLRGPEIPRASAKMRRRAPPLRHYCCQAGRREEISGNSSALNRRKDSRGKDEKRNDFS